MTDLIINQVGSAGHIHLNRPKALNALTFEMVIGMSESLDGWKRDRGIESVIVTGEGDRAFCAGGDVKAAWRAGKTGEIGAGSLPDRFFREEYKLDYLVATYPKPYVSWLDGITMGGGVGISMLGSHRIASEHLKFAMPETAIGFFPDVGGSYFLSRLGPVGTYLALTGDPIDAETSLSLGIATHLVKRESAAELVQRIGGEGVEEMLSKLATSTRNGDRLPKAIIDRCFGSFQMAEIIASLESTTTDAEFGEFARTTLATLLQRSPTSLLVTLELLRRGRELSLRDCLAMEFRVSQACMQGHDFFEGVRAMLVDKDYAPKWSPSTWQEVGNDSVMQHFEELGSRELRLPVLSRSDEV